MRIGAHVPAGKPLDEVAARHGDTYQLFLGSPRTWRLPAVRKDADLLAASDIPSVVHSLYLANPASATKATRDKTVSAISDTLTLAAAIGSTGVVIHGGHAGKDGTVDQALQRWGQFVDALVERADAKGEDPTELPPLLIENTATGTSAAARHLDEIARLFDVVRGRGLTIGFCLDTCHSHAGEPSEVTADPNLYVTELISATGGIDVVHVNDSKDPAGAGRDRHDNLGAGLMDPDVLVEMVAASGAPIAVVETPGDADAHARDIAWLRERLGSAGA